MNLRTTAYWGGILGLVAIAAGWLLQSEPENQDLPVPSGIARVLEAQSKLPPESVSALQDLRLIAAVEMAHFTQEGGYAGPEKLQADGYLDPQWPRAESSTYHVDCDFSEERVAFVCYADGLQPEAEWYMVDSTQVVRWERSRRPTARSPIFGTD